MSLKIPLIKDSATEAAMPIRASASPVSTAAGTEYTPLSEIARNLSDASVTSPHSSDFYPEEKDVVAPRRRSTCRVVLIIAMLTSLSGLLAAVTMLQFSGWLVPLLRTSRSWLHEGTPLPQGYCTAASSPLPSMPSSMEMSAITFSSWARKLVAQLTPEERWGLTNGAGYHRGSTSQADGFYVGNLLAVPRLGIPSIQMQDAAQGFRTTDARMIGQVTAWPCGLAIAAGWDTNATWYWSRAIANEFREKGANVLLGPAVNVHRIAANGRNAEYISGEDPVLGAGLAQAYVRGVQEGAGVVAVVKHFVLNQQETARMSVDSQADERTRWELYYPPFEAAVHAGVAAVMCSYNLINGEHACENSETITQDLKGRMGFSGWVMSDWWALSTNKGASAGADQDMPGNDGFFSNASLSALSPARLDDMATRVLTGMAMSGAWLDAKTKQCRVGCDCGPKLYGSNATSAEHTTLARTLASNSAVLLKNSRRSLSQAEGLHVLPLQPGERVAVLGNACLQKPDPEAMVGDFMKGDYYVVGGSGRVLSPHTVSVFDGLQGRGLRLSAGISENLEAAATAMRDADVAVLCGGATSSEAIDRTSLRLDNEVFLTKALHLANTLGVPAVVLALVPGAIVAPWRHSAHGVLAMFLSGQETGNAAADVLMGSVTPSGKLPVTFPEKEQDALWPCQASWPWAAAKCSYTERLRGGWHVYDGKPVAFPFGFGLSYTEFEYSIVQDWSAPARGSDVRQLTISVRNVGSVAGAEVAQLYLSFPHEEAEEPDMLLRGFQKTPVLLPGEAHEMILTLTRRDLSVWDAKLHAWRQPMGHFATLVGASSRDLRLCGGFKVDGQVEAMHACSISVGLGS